MIRRRVQKIKRWRKMTALILAAGISLVQAGSVLAEEAVIVETGGENAQDISEEQLADAAQSIREMVDLMQDSDDAQDVGNAQNTSDVQVDGNAQDNDDTQESDGIQNPGNAQNTDRLEVSPEVAEADSSSEYPEAVADDLMETDRFAGTDESVESDEAVLPDRLTEPSDPAEAVDAAEPDSLADPDNAVSSDAEDILSEEFSDVVDGELILGVEEVAVSERETDMAEIPADFPEVFEGQVSESGQAANASLQVLRSFSFENTVFTDSYGQQLSGNAKGLYDAMVTKYVSARDKGDMETVFAQEYTFETTEDAEEIGLEIDYAVQAAYDAFKYDYPEVFWMAAPRYKSDIGYRMINGSYTGYVTKFHLMPGEVYENASAEIAAFDSAVNNAVGQLTALSSGMTMREKVRLIHDVVCMASVYPDPDSNGVNIQEYSYSPSGIFLKDGYVVCEGYAKSIKILCNKLGIACVLIVGNAGGGHMWNYVKMDNGNWYLVDATWDDSDNLGMILYDYFLAGSQSEGFSSVKLCDERQIYTNFSGSTYTMDFAVPVLSMNSYDQENPSHTHTWVEKERVNPTCMAEGYAVNECSVCGAVARETFDKTEHSYQKKIAVYNHDATCLKDGTQTIYCDYGCGTAERTITKKGTKIKPTITINVTSIRLKKGQSTKAVKVTGLGPGDYVESWTTSNVKKAKVNGDKSGNCKITAGKKTGKATITVNLKSGLSKKITVNVQSGTVKTTKLSGIPKSITLEKGSTKKLSPIVSPITSGQKVRYSSSNKKVATVSSKGVIRAKKAGKAKITVSSGSKKVRVTVRVTK